MGLSWIYSTLYLASNRRILSPVGLKSAKRPNFFRPESINISGDKQTVLFNTIEEELIRLCCSNSNVRSWKPKVITMPILLCISVCICMSICFCCSCFGVTMRNQWSFLFFFFCGGEIICYFLLFDRNQSNQFQTTKLKIFFCSVSIPKSGMATTQKPGANPSFPLQSPTHRQCGYEFSTILNSLSISFLSASWILNCFSSYQNVEKVVSWTLYNWQEWDGEESTKSCINPWHGISVK